jgi:L-lactate utilization protein LutB
MRPPGTETFFAESRKTVGDAELRRKLEGTVGRHLQQVAIVAGGFPGYEHEKAAARRVKEEALSRLPELLEQLKQNLEAKGARVFFAADAVHCAPPSDRRPHNAFRSTFKSDWKAGPKSC